MQELCAAHGAVYVDYHSAVADQDGLTMQEGLSDDNLHPYVVGYNRMAAVLTPLLENALGAGKSS